MGTIIGAAAALQKRKEAERRRRAAEQLALIEPLAQAAHLAAELAELNARARTARKEAPPGCRDDLDAVVTAIGRAAETAADTQATAWKAATAGGWSARDLRALKLKPGRAKPAAAEPAAEAAPSNEDQPRAVLPA